MKNTTKLWTMIFVALMCIEMANFVIATEGNDTTTTVSDTTTTLVRRRYFSLSYSPETPLTGDCIVLTVTDRSTGDELSDVDVDVNFEGKKTFYGVTDSDGKFTFCPTAAGSYEVELDKTRYQQYADKVPVGQAVVTTTVVTTKEVITTTTVEETTEDVATTEEIPTTTEEVITTTEEVPTTTEVITTTTIQEQKNLPDITIWMIAIIVIVIILAVLYMMTKKKKTGPEEKSKKGKEKEE